jgi:flavin-dependent dehydrogenase
MIDCDVLICGAGPAGATAALNLAPGHRVLLVDGSDFPSAPRKAGESLPAAAGRLLGDMGLLPYFLAQMHLPCHSRRSVWGSDQVETTDLLREPDGHGWLLERAVFDAWLRNVAGERSAALCLGVKLLDLRYDPSCPRWTLTLRTQDGRHANMARRLGGQRLSCEPRLVCAWLTGATTQKDAASAGCTLVEAAEDGWWYTAPLPGDRRVLAFHTDPATARTLTTPQQLAAKAARAGAVADTLSRSGFRCSGPPPALTLAQGGGLAAVAGDGWFAVGDAAVHFDPLASQGLLNALFLGLAAAECASQMLAGFVADAGVEYQSVVHNIEAAYRARVQAIYKRECRWRDVPFWRMRH